MGLRNRLGGYFVAGLLLLTPLIVTVFVVRTLYRWLLGTVRMVAVESGLTTVLGPPTLTLQVGVATAALLLVVFVGFLTSIPPGRRFLHRFGQTVDYIPIVRSVYRTVHDVVKALGSGGSRFKRAVLVEHPREGVYSIGFVTADSPEPMQDAAGKNLKSVYMPYSPNPTNGTLIAVPEEDLFDLDLSTRAGLRYLVTTGLTTETAPEQSGA